MSGQSLEVQRTAHKCTQINYAIEQYPRHLSFLPALSRFCPGGPQVNVWSHTLASGYSKEAAQISTEWHDPNHSLSYGLN